VSALAQGGGRGKKNGEPPSPLRVHKKRGREGGGILQTSASDTRKVRREKERSATTRIAILVGGKGEEGGTHDEALDLFRRERKKRRDI